MPLGELVLTVGSRSARRLLQHRGDSTQAQRAPRVGGAGPDGRPGLASDPSCAVGAAGTDVAAGVCGSLVHSTPPPPSVLARMHLPLFSVLGLSSAASVFPCC